VDRTLIRENLKLTVEQRFRQLMELQRFAEELQRAGKSANIHREKPTNMSCQEPAVFKREEVQRIRQLFVGRTFSDSVPLLCKDRER
jgi:hypothetical protein